MSYATCHQQPRHLYHPKIQHMISASDELKQEIEKLREQTDERFQIVFEVLDQLLNPGSGTKKEIGFTVKEQVVQYG